MSKSVYRIITLLTLAFLVFIFSSKKVEAFESGTGVDSDPYVITTCTHLQEIQNDPTAYYVLAQDIDCSDTINWNEGSGFQPIGGGQDFWGVLDGMYFTIYDLYINRPTESGVGLFDTVEGGIVGGLNIERAYINGSHNVGVVAGRSSEGEYYDIHVKDSVVIGDLTGNDMVGRIGGLVGVSEDNIIFEYCSFEGTISGHASLGGLLGHSVGGVSISDSYNEGIVTGNYYTGGLLGSMEEEVGEATLSIYDSYNTGEIEGKYASGGMIGNSNNNTILENTYNEGVVSGFSRVGGVIGYSKKDISITDSYNTGNVNGYYRVGGLLGSVEEKITLLRSYNEGSISSLLSDYDSDHYNIPTYIEDYICIGGLVGAAWKSDISKSYNIGSLQVLGGSRSVGGILGCGGLIDIRETYNKGDVNAELSISKNVNMDGVGGLVGMGINLKIKDSYNTGDLSIGYWEDCNEDEVFGCGILPYSGGVVGTSIVSSVRNSYNRGNITIYDSETNVAEGGIGGLFGFLYINESIIDDIFNYLEKTFVARVTTFAVEVINNFAVGFITNNLTDEDVYVGGLVGVLFVGDCTENNCVDEYVNFQNNWWFNGISKAIGYITGDTLSIPEMYSNDQEESRFERASAMEIFKEYSHKVYNTDPDWDFDTIWDSAYDGKGYPVLGIQELVAPTSPVANVTSGTYSSAFNVSLSSTGTSIRYTVNGSSPTCSIGNIYTTVIPVSSNSVIRAVGCIDGIASSVSVFTYNIASQEESIPLIDNTPSLTKLIIRKNISPNTILNDIVEVVVEENIEHENEVEDLQEEYFGVRIIDSKGNVLIGVRVTIVGKEYITDENGEIEIRDVDNGEYKLKITYNGNDYEQSLILGESDDVQEIVIEDIKKFPWWIVIILCGTLLSIVMYKVVKKENI